VSTPPPLGREYGLATPDQFRERSGLDLLRAMIAGELPAPPISQAMGILLVEVEKGRALFEGRPGPHLFNPLGGVPPTGWCAARGGC
jgi:hypothetical protein